MSVASSATGAGRAAVTPRSLVALVRPLRARTVKRKMPSSSGVKVRVPSAKVYSRPSGSVATMESVMPSVVPSAFFAITVSVASSPMATETPGTGSKTMAAEGAVSPTQPSLTERRTSGLRNCGVWS